MFHHFFVPLALPHHLTTCCSTMNNVPRKKDIRFEAFFFNSLHSKKMLCSKQISSVDIAIVNKS